MGLFHYQIAIDLLSIYIKVSAFFGKNKSKKSIKGQKNWQKNLSNLNSDKKTFWIHAASHGEAIMASSLVKEILNQKNNQVVMSFFSPSGYDNYNFENEIFINFICLLIKKEIQKKL